MCFNLRNAIRDIPNKILKGAAKQVLGELADCCTKGQSSCFPSKTRISLSLGVDKRTVQRALRVLEESGYITTEARHRSNGSTASNKYHLDIDKIKSVVATNKEETPVQASKQGGDNLSKGGELSLAGGHDASSSNDHINDQVNTPISPEGEKAAAKDKPLPATKNPRHHDYKLTDEDKRHIQTTWNDVADGRFTESRVFTAQMERALKNTYKIYKAYQKQGLLGDTLRTKVELALLIIANFNNNDTFWCDKNNTERRGKVADLHMIIRPSFFEKMIQ